MGMGDVDGLRESSESVRMGFDGVSGDGLSELMNAEAIYSVQRMAELLAVGPDSEREFVLFELQQLLDHCLDDTLRVLIPTLCDNVASWEVELQFRAAEALQQVVGVSLSSEVAWMITVASYRVLEHVEGRIEDDLDRDAFYELWGGTINDALLQVSRMFSEERSDDILRLVDQGAQSDIIPVRKLAAKVLGSLAQTFSPTAVSSKLLPRALPLCSDSNILVRGTAAESLAFIGAVLPCVVTEVDLWPIFLVFLDDGDARIRATTLRTISHILKAKYDIEPSEHLFKDLLIPILLQWANFARQWAQEDQRTLDDDTYLLLEVIAEVFGNLTYCTARYVKLGFRKQAIRAYCAMSTCNGPLIRRNCSFNLPGMAATLSSKYGVELSNIVEHFSRDTDAEVRGILAAGLHVTVTQLYSGGRVDKLISAVTNLLQDDHPAVRMLVLEHFAETIGAVVKEGEPSALRRLTPLLEHVRFLSQGEWRSQERFADQLGDCVNLIPQTLLKEKVLPILLELCETGVCPVRRAAVKSMVRSFRYFREPVEREHIVRQFWARLAEGTHIDRITMLEGGRFALELFSSVLFQSLFAKAMLDFANDPVPNVRLKLALLLPDMSGACEHVPEFIMAYGTLLQDDDIDVKEAMQTHHRRAGKLMQVATQLEREDRKKLEEEAKLYNGRKNNSNFADTWTKVSEDVKTKIDNLRPTKKGATKRPSGRAARKMEADNFTDLNSRGSSDEDLPAMQRSSSSSRSSSLKDAIADIAKTIRPRERRSTAKQEHEGTG
mmetsp:Transcript_12157/g.24804  ORF Transcript_12157/g.24804 Transcript_12157/m.24804 type:complete len:778 (-) Transcript_12157:1501-3834(-)